MPYSGANDPDLPSNVKDMPTKDRKQWVEVFNSTYNACIKDGGSTKTCEGKAFRYANGVLKKKYQSLFRFIRNLFDPEYEELQEQALGFPDLYNQIAMAAYNDENSRNAWLVNVYLDKGGMFAIFSSEGALYKASVKYNANKNEATIPPFEKWEKVQEEFVPVSQNKFAIRAQKDGSVRWLLIAGTTVLNRNAEIDSSELFDDMIAKCEQSGKYPYLTFFHLGKSFEMGTCDFLAREGVALVASGLFDLSKKVAQSMVKAYEEDPDYWGSSLGFYAEHPDMVEIARDIKLPVYKKGELIEISILPEEQACAVMTALRSTKEVNRMNKRTEEAIKKLAGEDEELAEEFIGMVDDVNRSVEEQGLIHREASEENSEETTTEETTTEETTTEETTTEETTESVEQAVEEGTTEEKPAEQISELEVDEELVQRIADQVIADPKIAGILENVEKAIADLAKEVHDLHASGISTSKKLSERIESLEHSDEEKRRQWEQDLSPKIINKIRVTHRPTQRSEDETSDKQSFAEIASQTLSNLK